jgi:hypothetical protein
MAASLRRAVQEANNGRTENNPMFPGDCQTLAWKQVVLPIFLKFEHPFNFFPIWSPRGPTFHPCYILRWARGESECDRLDLLRNRDSSAPAFVSNHISRHVLPRTFYPSLQSAEKIGQVTICRGMLPSPVVLVSS